MNSLENPQIVELSSVKLECTPFDTLWIPKSPNCILLAENPKATGRIAFYTLKENKLQLLRTIPTPHGVKCGTFEASDDHQRHLCTGDFKGRLQIWDLETSQTTFEVKAHDSLINGID